VGGVLGRARRLPARRDVVDGVRSPPRQRPADAAGAGCLRPGAVAGASMARLSTDKAPKIAPPERPSQKGRRTGGDANVCSRHETEALGVSTDVLCLRAVCSNGVQRWPDRSHCPSSHRYAVQTFKLPESCLLARVVSSSTHLSAAPASRSSPPATAMVVAAVKVRATEVGCLMVTEPRSLRRPHVASFARLAHGRSAHPPQLLRLILLRPSSPCRSSFSTYTVCRSRGGLWDGGCGHLVVWSTCGPTPAPACRGGVGW
jgi:hypothetical protein